MVNNVLANKAKRRIKVSMQNKDKVDKKQDKRNQIIAATISLPISLFIGFSLYTSSLWGVLFTAFVSLLIFSLIHSWLTARTLRKYEESKSLSYRIKILSGGRKFNHLFNKKINDEFAEFTLSDTKTFYRKGRTIKDWQKYCLSRRDEYKPAYDLHTEIRIINAEDNTAVKGIITGVEFGSLWWEYVVCFDKPIRLNTVNKSRCYRLSAKQVLQIQNGITKCNLTKFQYTILS